MTMLKVVLLVAVVTLMYSVLSTNGNRYPKVLCRSQRRFSADLVRAKEMGGNVLYSPISIYRILLLMYLGSEGQTTQMLKHALHLDWVESKEHLWEAMKLQKQDYNTVLQSFEKIYIDETAILKGKIPNMIGWGSENGNIESFTFTQELGEIRKAINDEIKRATGISHTLKLGSIDLDTELVLASAAFFKAQWKSRFEWIFKEEFHSPSGKILVDMMAGSDDFLLGNFILELINGSGKTNQSIKVQFLELPYDHRDSSVVMNLLLPQTDSSMAVDHVDLLTRSIDYFLSNERLMGSHQRILVYIPEIDLEHSTVLSAHDLEKLGITGLFGGHGDLSAFTDDSLPVDCIHHKAAIDFNENGNIDSKQPENNDPRIICNHPFAFVIQNQYKEVLLVGTYY